MLKKLNTPLTLALLTGLLSSTPAFGQTILSGDHHINGSLSTGISTATGALAVGFGGGAASGDSSFAMGNLSTATESNSIALGFEADATAIGSVALGAYSNASGYLSTGLGAYAFATGDYSVALGVSAAAQGVGSIAMGLSTNSNAYGAITLGMNSESIGGTSPSAWVAGDPLLIVGNGDANPADTNYADTSNALVILKNGNTGIGTNAPAETLDVDGSVSVTGDVTLSGQTTIDHIVPTGDLIMGDFQ